MDFLAVEGLTKFFGGLAAVYQVGFTVQEGEIIGLIGPNGSGKTTVLNLISGFLKPDAGRVTLAGRDVTGLPPHRMCQNGKQELVWPPEHASAPLAYPAVPFDKIRSGHRRRIRANAAQRWPARPVYPPRARSRSAGHPLDRVCR